METILLKKDLTDFWKRPPTIERNNFKYKSLSSWALNMAVGCGHGCRFCYVPDASTIRLGEPLAEYGVKDPDEEWGKYVLIRPWHQERFLSSLMTAERTEPDKLNADGNRAVMLCTTTDAYQFIKHKDAARRNELNAALADNVRKSLSWILSNSTLNVRILTRSPLAKKDFLLMKKFGPRLTFGMSIPTLNNRLAKVYEPDAPSPTKRLECLKAAKDSGLNVFAAMAPTYPECDAADLEATLRSLKALDPVTVFHEPINIRADNVARIDAQARSLGMKMKTEVFETKATWTEYALSQLYQVEALAKQHSVDQLHLWPDAGLGTQAILHARGADYAAWLNKWWNRVSEWPKS